MSHTKQKMKDPARRDALCQTTGVLGPDETVETEAVRCDAPVGDDGERGTTGYNSGTHATDRQLEVLREVAAFRGAFGTSPTVRELGEALDIKSTNGVKDHLVALERKGLLHYPLGRNKARGMMPTDEGQRVADEEIARYNEARGVDAA